MADRSPRPNELRMGAILSYLEIAFQLLVAMIYTPIMLRLLGQTEYGLYSLVASMVSYLSLLSFGFGGAYMRFFARFRVVEDWEGVRRLNGLFFIVFTVIGLLAAVGGLFLTLNVGFVLGPRFSLDELRTARALFLVLTLNLAITFPSSVFSSYIFAHERFVFQKSLQVAKSITSPLVVLPVLLLGYQSVGMAIATTVVNITFTVYGIAFARLRLKMMFTFRSPNFGLLKEIWVFSSFLFINMVVDQVNWSVDKFIIGRFHGPRSVAVYGVAGMIATIYPMFAASIAGLFVPRVNRMVADAASDQDLSELFMRIGRLQFLVLALVASGFVFFGRPFIALWAGPEYSDAYYITLLLIIPVTLPMIQNLGIEISTL